AVLSNEHNRAAERLLIDELLHAGGERAGLIGSSRVRETTADQHQQHWQHNNKSPHASPLDHEDLVIRVMIQSPSAGHNCAIANSSRARPGTTNSTCRRSHAARIRRASQLGSMPFNWTPPPGALASGGKFATCASYRLPASSRRMGPGQTNSTCKPCGP